MIMDGQDHVEIVALSTPSLKDPPNARGMPPYSFSVRSMVPDRPFPFCSSVTKRTASGAYIYCNSRKLFTVLFAALLRLRPVAVRFDIPQEIPFRREHSRFTQVQHIDGHGHDGIYIHNGNR